MNNSDYFKLIRNKKFEELSNIECISDLTKYTFYNKYLLEYLLEKSIHNKRMDNQAIQSKLWINLYIKYNIIDPLLNCSLQVLLLREENEFLLEKVLRSMNDIQRIKLYKNIKYRDFPTYHQFESKIIDIYSKFGITLPHTFVKFPQNVKPNLIEYKKKTALYQSFIEAFKDTEPEALDIYITELVKKSKIDNKRTRMDIADLIKLKEMDDYFKLYVHGINRNEMNHGKGVYNCSQNFISINQYETGIFNHEFSHALAYNYDSFFWKICFSEFCKIRREINQKSKINDIVSYLNKFHKRYDYMFSIFVELYYKEINRQFGSFNNYLKVILTDLILVNPDTIGFEKAYMPILLDTNNQFIDKLADVAIEIVSYEGISYADTCTNIYYDEELFLENLLDALLRGRIYDDKYDVTSYSGHGSEYFKMGKYHVLDECLANYEAIKYSKKANQLISKLRELVGDDLVNFLEDYINKYRGENPPLDIMFTNDGDKTEEKTKLLKK